jgi:hypothetical protein
MFLNFGMTTLGQSYETIMKQSPQWIMKQLKIEQDKTKEDKPDKMTRKELLTMQSVFNQFDRLKELDNACKRKVNN